MKGIIIYMTMAVVDGAMKIESHEVVPEDNGFEWLQNYRERYPEERRLEIGVGKTFKSVDGTKDLTLVRLDLSASSIGRAGDGEFLANAMGALLNVLGSTERDRINAFCSAMSNEHRTLQQTWMRLIVAWVKQMSEANTDGRNEASGNLARAIIANVPEEKLYLPMV